jgi:hypothetical protein
MEAVLCSEVSVSLYQTTRRNIAKDTFHNCCRENLKPHTFDEYCFTTLHMRTTWSTYSSFKVVKTILFDIL